MKNLRNYNIYFHLHTISGIFACLLLYVIFFAGSFSFFKEDISAWQKNTSRKAHPKATVNYDAFIDSLGHAQNLLGRDVEFTFRYKSPDGYVNISGSKDSVVQKQLLAETSKKQRGRSSSTFFKYNTISKEKGSYEETYDLGEFLYRLHFLAQLNQVPIRIGYPFGYMLAGLVSFLFLFALITGLLLHWDKLVSNFFTFRPLAKLKTLWTDAHTALGVLGFPYQFLYAVTGLFLIVNTVLVAPFSKALYKGRDQELYTDIGLRQNPEYNYTYKPLAQKIPVQPFIQKTKEMWPQAVIENVQIKNYGDSSMHVIIENVAPYDKQFSGSGSIIFHAATGKIVYAKSPASSSGYIEKIRALIYRLHFGDFGGYPLKIVYFILGLMGCVVIVSGILIWQVARDKKHVPAHKRKFNFWTANVFLAICLSMFPVTAFTFIAVKLHGSTGQSFIYNTFFYSWLVLSVYFIVRRNLKRTNNETLLLGSLLALAVPIANGIFSDNWPWHTQKAGATDILLLDLLWLGIGITGIFSYCKIRRREKSSAGAKA